MIPVRDDPGEPRRSFPWVMLTGPWKPLRDHDEVDVDRSDHDDSR